MDSHPYLTGSYALCRHNLITQIPAEITCFTNRRHNKSRVRTTPVGRFAFVCVSRRVYSEPTGSVLAGAEQALCDFVYLLRRRGLRPESVVTFRNLDKVRPSRRMLNRYPASVRNSVLALLAGPGRVARAP